MENQSIFKASPIKGFSRKTVVYVPVDSPSKIIRKFLSKASIKKKNSSSGTLFLLDDKIVLYGCIGAPLAVLFLEGLIASGAERIVVLGFSGSLCPRARMLDAVSVVEAFSDEGTSPHYCPGKKDFYPSQDLKEKVEAIVRKQDLPFLCGSIVSTDAPYRETESWLAGNLDKGIDCVDMETSAVFALAQHHKLQAAALMLVSDELSFKGHKTGFNNPEMDEHISGYFLAIIEYPFAERSAL